MVRKGIILATCAGSGGVGDFRFFFLFVKFGETVKMWFPEIGD